MCDGLRQIEGKYATETHCVTVEYFQFYYFTASGKTYFINNISHIEKASGPDVENLR